MCVQSEIRNGCSFCSWLIAHTALGAMWTARAPRPDQTRPDQATLDSRRTCGAFGCCWREIDIQLMKRATQSGGRGAKTKNFGNNMWFSYNLCVRVPNVRVSCARRTRLLRPLFLISMKSVGARQGKRRWHWQNPRELRSSIYFEQIAGMLRTVL